MLKCIQRFILFLGLVAGPYSGSFAASAINLDALFWEKPETIENLPFTVVASFFDGENSSFLLKAHKDGALVFVNETDPLEVNGTEYVFEGISDKEVTFLRGDRQIGRITLSPEVSETSDVAQTVIQKNAPVEQTSLAPKQVKKIRPRTGFYSGPTTLSAIHLLAERIGLPQVFINTLQAVPEKGRSRAGRPGWVLDDSLPPAFFVMSPFEKGDIILTVDGISAHDVDGLIAYIEGQTRTKRYKVELERNKRLKLIEVYTK